MERPDSAPPRRSAEFGRSKTDMNVEAIIHFSSGDARTRESEYLLEDVEVLMLDCAGVAGKPDALLSQAIENHFRAGGGRTRALLALHSAHQLLLGEQTAIALAASAELLHNASLIHDDLQDRSPERRDQPAVWVQHGENAAICAGDLLISAAFRALSVMPDYGHLPELIQRVHERVRQVIYGQMDDLDAAAEEIEFSHYENIAAAKSGPLLGLGLELTLLAAGFETESRSAVHAARHFAIAYQIMDDLEDQYEDSGEGRSARCLNAVNILAATGSPDPEAEALQKAGEALGRARQLSATLPCGAGDPLLEHISCMQRRIMRVTS